MNFTVNKGSRVFFHLLIALLLFPIILPIGQAGSIGVSPISLRYEQVLKDGYAEKYIVVTTSINSSIPIYGEASGEIEEWIHFLSLERDGTLGYVRRGEPLSIPVAITPPRKCGNW